MYSALTYCELFDIDRIESYSCKMAGNDKRLFKLLSEENREAPGGLQALSPPQSSAGLTAISHSPGRYDEHHIIFPFQVFGCFVSFSNASNSNITVTL